MPLTNETTGSKPVLRSRWAHGHHFWWIGLTVIGLASAFALASCIGADAGASPAQPIAFPHQAHTENQIDCAFCHSYAENYATAGMPDTDLCGSCHLAMEQNSDATRKLIEFVEDGEEIPWVRLYDLPQYAYFPHKWHVRAGLACETCHGEIGDSVVAERHVDMKMEWCVDCHEQTQAANDCVDCHS